MDECEDFDKIDSESNQQNLSNFILNEVHLDQGDEEEDLNFFNQQSDIDFHRANFFDRIEHFNECYESFFSCEDDEQKFVFLNDLRKEMIVRQKRKNQPEVDYFEEKKPIFKITEPNGAIEEFIKILVRTHRSTNIFVNIEILRILNRLSQSYVDFLNPQNIEEFISLMDKRTSKEADPLVIHFALIAIGKIVRQSRMWASKLLSLLPFIFDNIDFNFKCKEYYFDLEKRYLQLLNSIQSKNDLSNKYQIPKKKGDPYIYAVRGYTKMLAKTGDLPEDVIFNIMKKIFTYFHDQNEIKKQEKRYQINWFSGAKLIKILNDIITDHYPSILKNLKIMDSYVKSFFEEIIPDCFNSIFNYYVAIISASRLITSFYKGGEQYSVFFETFDFKLILRALFIEVNYIKLHVSVAECIYYVLETAQSIGFDLFFKNEKDEYDLENFNKILEITANGNIPYQQRVAFYKLTGNMFKFYVLDSIEFDASAFIESILTSIDLEDYDLSCAALYSLDCLYDKMKILGFFQDFVDIFTELDGRDSIESIIDNEEGELNEQAALFMQTLMDDGVPCAQLE